MLRAKFYLSILAISLLLGVLAAYLLERIAGPAHAVTGADETREQPAAPTPGTRPAGIDPAELEEAYNFNEADLERFHSWIRQTIDETNDTDKYAVIIDKAAYKLYLVHRGEISARYPIELGFNPVDDKRMEGDGTTPEGMYWTVDKRDKGQTVFYRGFLINYPNQQDREEFRRLKESGAIEQSATIGGGIMLHGTGSGMAGNGGGSNWTLGCIAVSNEQIDELFPLLTSHTRVTIVRYSRLADGADAIR